jgi:hypothetical protein
MNPLTDEMKKNRGLIGELRRIVTGVGDNDIPAALKAAKAYLDSIESAPAARKDSSSPDRMEKAAPDRKRAEK